jgi:uncharacterized protein
MEEKGEVQELLTLAEEIQERLDSMVRRSSSLRFYALSILTLATGVIGVLLLADSMRPYRWAIAAVATLYAVMAALLLAYNDQRTARRIRQEAMSLEEVTALLRETVDHSAAMANWSTLERAQFRIRLARFDIRPQIPKRLLIDRPNPSNRAEGMRFEVYADAQGQYRWRLKSPNGQTLAVSADGYPNKASAVRSIDLVRRSTAASVAD